MTAKQEPTWAEQSEKLDDMDVKIDDDSARMMRTLSESIPPVATSAELLENTHLDNTTQINYRMDNHLIPAGLVAEIEQPDEGGDQARQYQLTDLGTVWCHENQTPLGPEDTVSEFISDFGGRLDTVKTRLTDVEDGLEAHDETNQKLSGKIGGIESQIEQISADIDELDDDLTDLRSSVDSHDDWLIELTDQSNDNLESVKELDDKISDIPDQPEINPEDYLSAEASKTITSNSDAIRSIREQIDDLDTEIQRGREEAQGALRDADEPSETAVRADRRANRLKWIIIVQSALLAVMIAVGLLVFGGFI
jgi:predicted  nucleic acid-binding Zn-ribbon protein